MRVSMAPNSCAGTKSVSVSLLSPRPSVPNQSPIGSLVCTRPSVAPRNIGILNLV